MQALDKYGFTHDLSNASHLVSVQQQDYADGMIEFTKPKRLISWAIKNYPETLAPVLKGLSLGRSAVYFSEGLPLIFANRLRRSDDPPASPPHDYRESVVRHATRLIDHDIQNMVDGFYGPEVLWPERSWLAHIRSFANVLQDGLSLGSRQTQQVHKEFGKQAESLLGDTPEYYRRNFHFQKDGYLSEDSANLYDHQVEILFRGMSDPMRRLLLKPLKQAAVGDDLKILDLGCGTGSSTRFLAQGFPGAKITAFDLSFPYLKKAQQRLPKFTSRIEFVQGAGEDLPFKDEQFDIVASTFVFHELPIEVRRRVLAEMHRVLKPGGQVAIIDSIQKGDVPDLEWGLEQFPKDFHEPFFKNYLLNPLEGLITTAGFGDVDSHVGFLAKGVLAKKR